jgi:hypothetical protein
VLPGLRDRLVSFFQRERPDAIAVYVFGSVARGEDVPDSDIDVAVLFDHAPPRTLEDGPLALAADLERDLRRPVDLVVLNTAPADLVHRVLRDGAIVVDRDRGRRLRFEVGRRNEFFDLEPVRRRYRRPAQAL